MGVCVCFYAWQSLLPLEDTVVFVVSTTGQGDTPDSMKVGLGLMLNFEAFGFQNAVVIGLVTIYTS